MNDTGQTKTKRRPRSCDGMTIRYRTQDVYITLNEHEERLFEIFIHRGKAGGMEGAYCEALARVLSEALRAGVDPERLKKHLKGIAGPNPVWEDAELLLSVPDCVGRAIEEWIKTKKKTETNKDENDE